MGGRRRSRNYRRARQSKTKLSFTPVIVILCLSVVSGYATAKYVVEPAVNYVPELTAKGLKSEQATEQASEQKEEIQSQTEKNTDVVEDQVNIESAGKVSGYALQFGCYSQRTAAEAAMKGIGVADLQVVEQDNMYKIVGQTYASKEKAQAAMKELPETVSAFVTTLYK